MTTAGRREKVTRHRIEPEHSAQQASNTLSWYRPNQEARREPYREPQKAACLPEDNIAKEDNERTEHQAVRD